MARVFLLILLFWLLYVVVKRLLSNVNSTAKSNKEKVNSESIVRCNHCGLYIPEGESKTHNELIYCNNPDCFPKETQDGNK